jgi:hypothetical protein
VLRDSDAIHRDARSLLPEGYWHAPYSPRNVGGLLRERIKVLLEWFPELKDELDDELLAELNIKRG